MPRTGQEAGKSPLSALAALPLEAQQTTVLAAVSGWKGVRSIVSAENWEDPEGFQPYLYVDTTEDMDAWRKAVQCYESLRGAQARRKHATAFNIGAMGKRRVAELRP